MIELSIQSATKSPSNFMYIWADENKFLSKIDPTYAAIIRTKRANENKLIELSARKYNTTADAYKDAIREAFVNRYGMTPAAALVKLANGEEVAGKNWKEGVFGIGSVRKDFKDTDISVNPKNGYMMKNGSYLPVYDTVYDAKKGDKNGVYQLFYFDEESGRTYMSQYNKTLKKFYAQSYSTKDGQKYTAAGAAQSEDEDGTVWEGVVLSLGKFLEWLLSLFSGSEVKTLNAENTLPSQTADGFVQTSGFGEAGGILLALVAGGALLAGGIGGGKKGKK